MGTHKVLTTEKEMEEICAKAQKEPMQPLLLKVSLSHLKNKTFLVLHMSNGSMYWIPKNKLEKLANISDAELAKAEIEGNGTGIRWSALDWDLFVPNLLQGIYGTAKWMTCLGQQGGRAKTEAKRQAARKNGLKGGRPRKAAIA